MSANDELQAHTCEKVMEEYKNVANNVANANSQDLTEQWKKGKLEFGAYYVNRLEEHRIWLYNDRSKTPESQHEIYEILAPVPSYEEWQRLKEFADYSLHNRNELTRQINFWMDKYTQLEKENQQLKESHKRLKDTQNLELEVRRENQQLKKLLLECRYLLKECDNDFSWDDDVKSYHLIESIDNAIGEKK